MVSGINTNVGAMTAVRVLNATNAQLDNLQARISSGLRVATAKDNGATYGIAQQQRSEVNTIEAVKVGLSRATSAADVALAAGQAISDTFMLMRDKAVAATGISISPTTRAALNDEFVALRDSIASIIANANFDGINLLGGSGGGPLDVTFPASTDGLQVMRLPILDLNLTTSPPAMPPSGPGMYLDVTSDLTTDVAAQDTVARIIVSLDYINQELSRMGTAARRVENHVNFITRLSDSITEGIGNLVDADLAKDSAQLQALQVRQQMGSVSLNIANQAPNILLSLLRT
jgi:flagellin